MRILLVLVGLLGLLFCWVSFAAARGMGVYAYAVAAVVDLASVIALWRRAAEYDSRS
jgi:hypothetical protein